MFVKLQLILFFNRILAIIIFPCILYGFFEIFLDLHLRHRALFLLRSACLHPEHLQVMILDLIRHVLNSTAVDDLFLHL